MTKLDLAPACLFVTLFTLGTLSAVVDVIVFVTFDASGLYFDLVRVFLVAVLAFEVFMATPDREFRVLVMIE